MSVVRFVRRAVISSSVRDLNVFFYRTPVCCSPAKRHLAQQQPKTSETSRVKPQEGGEEAWFPMPKHEERNRLYWARRTDPDMERAARLRQIRVPAVDVRTLDHKAWTDYGEPRRMYIGVKLRNMAKLYNIPGDVFGWKQSRKPSVQLLVDYEGDEGLVHQGNFLAPVAAKNAPTVRFNASADDEGCQWSLLLVTPDGCIPTDGSANVRVHWAMCNITDTASVIANDAGNTVVPYTPPQPFQGTGYYRYVFCLLRQSHGAIDPASLSERLTGDTEKLLDLPAWTDDQTLIPLGFQFFQAQWDTSCDEA